MATGTAQDDFRTAMEAASVVPLWERFRGGMAHEPTGRPPFIWRWADLGPLTERTAHEVPMEHVERRVLTLDSPHFQGDGAGTTTNVVGAVQTLLPGETARLHRHSGNALRFIMSGNGAETIVDGKHCLMNERDLVLTPLWSWHGHVHNGDDRIVWFDALDIPLFRHMNAAFAEEGPPHNLPPQAPDTAFANGGLTPQVEGEAPRYSPMFRYPWEAVQATLAEMPAASDGSRTLRYTNPHTGGTAMTLLDCFMIAPGKGKETRPYRTTASAICVVADGEGTTTVGEHKVSWQRNDIFTLPNWNWISHMAASDDARLFMVSDRDAIGRLGMLREETGG